MRKSALALVLLTALLLSGCASFRSGIEGGFSSPVGKNLGAPKVKVLFLFSHYRQSRGFDAIPKLDNRYEIVKGFEDLFIDAQKELTNIGHYDAFTEYASDVGDPDRRHKLDSLESVQDYIIHLSFKKEHSFAKHFLGTFFSCITATVLPIPYSKDYSVLVNVHSHEGALVGSYERSASLTKWVESLLLFVYPFYTEKRVEEEIYINFMRDAFRQIESEKILGKGN